ncbi:MAG: hypothetical protein EXR90_00395 [Methyloglobulus sp.]|nr:hypothetical protein [Methyloglobulus sp.]
MGCVPVQPHSPFDLAPCPWPSSHSTKRAISETEVSHDERFKTRSDTKHQVFEYIEAHYNRKRLYSKLDCLSPIAFETKKVA